MVGVLLERFAISHSLSRQDGLSILLFTIILSSYLWVSKHSGENAGSDWSVIPRISPLNYRELDTLLPLSSFCTFSVFKVCIDKKGKTWMSLIFYIQTP